MWPCGPGSSTSATWGSSLWAASCCTTAGACGAPALLPWRGAASDCAREAAPGNELSPARQAVALLHCRQWSCERGNNKQRAEALRGRLFERQAGSSKYGAFAALSLGLPLAASLAARVPAPSGPFSLIAANFVSFVLDVPPTARFSVFGWRLTDKARAPCCFLVQPHHCWLFQALFGAQQSSCSWESVSPRGQQGMQQIPRPA
jgi:hypothetical protein